MHRDIKPDNLLVAKPLVDPHQLTADDIKVTDFGISVPFTPGQVGTVGMPCGSFPQATCHQTCEELCLHIPHQSCSRPFSHFCAAYEPQASALGLLQWPVLHLHLILLALPGSDRAGRHHGLHGTRGAAAQLH